MAVPGSGILSLVRIKNEVNEDDYTAGVSFTGVSLQELATGIINTNSASRPNTSAPHAMSEWYGYDEDAEPAFSDDYSVSKSITTGSGNRVAILDTDGSFNYVGTDAYSISFWVKAGWTSSLNTNIHLFASKNESGGTSDDQIRIYYNEANNRMYFEFRQNSTVKRNNFWLFHSTASAYVAAYNASGLGSTYWSASNRGNVGDDDFTMITITKGTASSTASSNIRLYWNGTSCGNPYSSSGMGSGTPVMTTSDRRVTIGSNVSYTKSGNGAETEYNDLTVWNKKLSDSEVSELYNSGTRLNATGHSAASNLKWYYKFENDGTDSSGNNAPTFGVQGDSNFNSI